MFVVWVIAAALLYILSLSLTKSSSLVVVPYSTTTAEKYEMVNDFFSSFFWALERMNE